VPYADAVDDLVRAAGEADVAISLEQPQREVLAFAETVFGPAIAAEIAKLGYPEPAELPWIVEELYLYGLEELSDRQAGYRTDARTGEASAGWDKDRFVIADWTANPISVGPDGAICYSRHGEGAWTYIRIAEDLPTFLSMLAAWLRYFVVTRSANLFDENFEIADETRDEIRREVLGAVEKTDQDAALRFLLGEL
jgi:hypothetical protein